MATFPRFRNSGNVKFSDKISEPEGLFASAASSQSVLWKTRELNHTIERRALMKERMGRLSGPAGEAPNIKSKDPSCKLRFAR